MFLSYWVYISQGYPNDENIPHDVSNFVYNTVTNQWVNVPLIAPRISSPISIIHKF